MNGLNRMHELEEERRWPARYALSVVMALVAGGLLLAATVFVVAGPHLLEAALAEVGLDTGAAWWPPLRWPVLALLVLLSFSLTYAFAPSTRQRVRLLTPGTVFAALAWLAFSFAYSVWSDQRGSYGEVYGVMASMIVLLLYAYWSSVILFLGAAIDRVLAARRE
jgi:membrane protein